jgi:hypothetical protein
MILILLAHQRIIIFLIGTLMRLYTSMVMMPVSVHG